MEHWSVFESREFGAFQNLTTFLASNISNDTTIFSAVYSAWTKTIPAYILSSELWSVQTAWGLVRKMVELNTLVDAGKLTARVS